MAVSQGSIEHRTSRHEDIPDEELMARVRLGDVRAFDRLVELHWDGLVTYAWSLTGDRDSAQDAVQETLTRLWQHRSEWRGQGSIRAYLHRAVRNRIIDRARRRRVWQRWAERWRHELVRLAGSPPGPIEDDRLPEAVQRCIDALPRRRREVFLLAHVQELTYREIADVLDLAPQTVANHMSLALRDLRKALAPLFPRLAGKAPSDASPALDGPAPED